MTDPANDAQSLETALRIAQAQNRELRKQLAAMRESLVEITNVAGMHSPELMTAQKALAQTEGGQD